MKATPCLRSIVFFIKQWKLTPSCSQETAYDRATVGATAS